MDRRRMDADGGRVVHRRKRTRRLAIVVAVQNVLVAACLVVTLYVCWDVQSRLLRAEQPGINMHIEFSEISDIRGNVTLQFPEVYSNKNMSLAVTGDKINIDCAGPYVLYVDLCYPGYADSEASGILQLQVKGKESPAATFRFPNLNTSLEVCRGLHSIVYLREREEASLHLVSLGEFKIKRATVGLSYLLGSRCVY